MESQTTNYWIGKKAKIEILKENKKLFYTADIMEIDNSHITFIDRAGVVYNFSMEFVKEMKEMRGGQNER